MGTRTLHREGHAIKEIARQPGRHRNTFSGFSEKSRNVLWKASIRCAWYSLLHCRQLNAPLRSGAVTI